MRRLIKKTEKGEEEIRSRKYGLASNLRRVLILVDGKTDAAKILEKGAGLPDVMPCLEELERQDFITTESSLTIADVKDDLISVARQTLGADAEVIIAKIKEAPDTREGLESTMKSCKKLVKLVIDEGKAAELMDKCSAILAKL